MKENRILKLIYAGLMMALVFVATGILPRIPIPFTQGSYIHAGDSMIFITAILFGWKYGAVVGGVGSALADIFVGATIWAFPTLIIKALMGAMVGFMARETKERNSRIAKNILSAAIGGVWIALGIYFTNTLKNISTSQLAGFLMQQLKLNSVEELTGLAGNVSNILLTAVITIPVLVVVLSIILYRKDQQLFSVSTLIGMTLGGLVMVVGYYVAEVLIVGNYIVPIFSIPFNLVQFIGGAVIAFVVLIPLKKAINIQV